MALNQERVIDPVIRSAYNGTGSTIVKGTIVKLATTPTYAGQITPATAATDPMFGVAMADIPTLQWGDCQVGGTAVVLAGASVSAGANVTADGSGKGVTASSGNAMIGRAATDGVNNGYMEVELTPGGEANN
jgi:hypothetical protein